MVSFLSIFLVCLVQLLFVAQQVHSRTSSVLSALATSKKSIGGFKNGDDTKKQLVLLIDVDNTLYSEKDVQITTGMGIESQIVGNINEFCQRHWNFTKEYCDQLHGEFGSTVEGLRHKIITSSSLKPINDSSTDLLHHALSSFYREVYANVDVTPLLRLSTTKSLHSQAKSTGYTHDRRAFPISNFLQSIPCPVYLVSNSPLYHVQKVISALGMQKCNFAGILTPDTGRKCDSILFPTKSNSSQFYESLLSSYPADEYRIVLLDDSQYNLRTATECGIHGIHINHDDVTLEHGLGIALQYVQPNNSNLTNNYIFSDVAYLRSKNNLDEESFNKEVWNRLLTELSMLNLPNGELHIADVGCGLLSMLRYFLHGISVNKFRNSRRLTTFLDSTQCNKIHYYAYELNIRLLPECRKNLRSMGLLEENKDSEEIKSEYIFSGIIGKKKLHVRVYLRFRDFTNDNFLRPLHLFVGCCFADLYDPEVLSREIARFANTESDLLVYLPLTHAGTTSFIPPSPFEHDYNIPSDTVAFRLYSESIAKRHGQCVDATMIMDAMEQVGINLILKGPSNWHIDPNEHAYLWETLVYFFGKCALPEMTLHHWNATGWIDRARKMQPSIHVSNVDLLFRLSKTTADSLMSDDAFEEKKDTNITCLLETNIQNETVSELLFVSPQKVEVLVREWKPLCSDDVQLGPDEVEIESICSLISSGTELKIFNGLFEEEQSLDTTIIEMKDSVMGYPLKYGYSLVGRVRRCGSNVKKCYRDELVFTFSCHASRAIVHKDSIHLVPSGIDPEDAIFFPSVETAVSIVQDANLRVGENVGVFGQGLIGLLVTYILCSSSSSLLTDGGSFGRVSVFDTIPDRLALASCLGASEALLPNDNTKGSIFDVCIEVSGNEYALQSAIDKTIDGGRVVIASWYGNKNVRLKLGTAFHRSHKTLIASQVSEIPSSLRMTWTKSRRFALAWELLRRMRPSKNLLTKIVKIQDAQIAYELLNGGKEIAVAIKY